MKFTSKVFFLILVDKIFAEVVVNLSSDGPAVLDAPITFTGELEGVDDPNKFYKWQWYDRGAMPNHYKETEVNSNITAMNYTITYNSKQYDSSTYKMVLTLFEYEFFYWRSIGKAEILFRITRELNGHLEVRQGGSLQETLSGESIISSIKETQIEAVFHDPSHFLDDFVIRYFWFINTVNYGMTQEGKFAYNFTKPGDYLVEVTAIADFPSNDTKNISDNRDMSDVSLSFNPDNRGISVPQGQPKKEVKMAIFQKKIISKQPITNITVLGEQMLKHGKLVDLDISCSGSAPWLFCWSIKEKGYNITGNETCDTPTLLKTDCEFPILWYFRQSDTYNVLVILNNDVSSHIEVIPVTIYDVATQAPFGIVIIPIVSSIMAVIMIITGIALHAHYRNRLAVEVADFDFGHAEDEELQYKSFWDRLRESFGNHFTSDLESEGSSVSGRRSVQMPGPVGIGYGSIT